MQTNNTPPTQNDAQQPTDEGLDDAACSAWREVTKAEFFKVVGSKDVMPSIQPGDYPYTSIWLTPQRQAVGKSVGRMKGGVEKKSWYLPNAYFRHDHFLDAGKMVSSPNA
jgi:hypothetical protein